MHESEKWKWSRSVVSDSSRPHGLQPTRLFRPWDFPGKSTGVGCHSGKWGFNPWVRKIPWRRNGSPLQYSCLENSMDRGAWPPTVPGITESDRTERLHFHFSFTYSLIKVTLRYSWAQVENTVDSSIHFHFPNELSMYQYFCWLRVDSTYMCFSKINAYFELRRTYVLKSSH